MGEHLPGKRGNARSQIALEFMIIYSIVLIIFVIVFALIANQRSVALAGQESSLMQLLAQNVAGNINQALQGGSGYSITAPLGVGIGQAQYNISVSTSGLVVARTIVGNEVITGEALSSARNLFINGTLVASGNGLQLYRLPAYTGSIYVSNAGGSIFVDEAPPSPSTLVGAASLSQPAGLDAPYFNGFSSLISANKARSLAIGNSITLEAWVYIQTINTQAAVPYVANPIIGESGSSTLPFMLAVSSSGIPIFLLNWGNGFSLQPTYGIAGRTWYDLAATYNKTSGAATLYINGNAVASATTSITISGSGNVIIGGSPLNSTYLNGYIADAQIYNTSLSANQIGLLYSGGPSAAPALSLSRLVGWWPLNGNSNDYSGYGNQGTPYGVVYYYVVDTLAKVLTLGGTPASGIPIGIASTNNLLGGSNSLSGYASQAGLQRTLLTSGGFVGNAFVQAEAFNGNLSTVQYLIGWWPLDLGTSGYMAEYSQQSVGGNFINGAYGYLANRTNTLVGQFNGVNSVISVANAPGLNPTNITIAAWFQAANTNGNSNRIVAKYNSGSNGNDYDIFYEQSIGEFGARLTTKAGGNSYYAVEYPTLYNSPHGLYFGAVTYQSSTNTISLYIDGNLIGTSSNTVAGPLSSSSSPLTIGYSSFNGQGWQGNISNVQIYSTALSSGQVLSLYNKGIASLPLPNSGLIGWWPLSGNPNNYASTRTPLTQTATQVSYYPLSSTNPSLQNTTLFPVFNGISKVVFGSLPLPNSNLCSLTIAAWAYDQGMPGAALGGVFNFSNTGHDEVAMNDNSVSFDVASSGTPDSWTVTPGYSLRGSWNLLVTRLSNGIVTGFINGIPAGTPQNSNVGCINVANAIFGYSGTAYMNGSIVDVQAYDAPLTNMQIEQLYLQGVPAVAQLNTTLG